MLWEQSLCLIIGHAGVNDNIFTLLPVNRGSDAVLVANLERINHANDFVKVTSS